MPKKTILILTGDAGTIEEIVGLAMAFDVFDKVTEIGRDDAAAPAPAKSSSRKRNAEPAFKVGDRVEVRYNSNKNGYAAGTRGRVLEVEPRTTGYRCRVEIYGQDNPDGPVWIIESALRLVAPGE